MTLENCPRTGPKHLLAAGSKGGSHCHAHRWRRMQLNDECVRRNQPKKYFDDGPTGVGKTEIARRLANCGAPFGVEATNFTEGLMWSRRCRFHHSRLG